MNLIISAHTRESSHISPLVLIIKSVRDLCVVDHGGDEVTIEKWVYNGVNAFLSADERIYVTDGHIVLGIGAMNYNGAIVTNYVAPEAVGYGVSTLIMNHMESLARDRGRRYIHLVSTMTARHFYRKRGYTEIRAPEKGVGNSWNFPMMKNLVPVCEMCDGTGLKDHAGFGMDSCDHKS